MTLVHDWDFYVIFNHLTKTYILLFGGSIDYCWATSSSLDHLGEIVERIIKKYKSPENFQRTIRGLSDYKYTPWNADMKMKRAEGDGKEFNHYVEEWVEAGVDYVKNAYKIEKEKRNLIQRKIHSTLRKTNSGLLHKKEKEEKPKKGLVLKKSVNKVKLIKR